MVALAAWLKHLKHGDARALTIRGDLVDCIFKKQKRVENRHAKLKGVMLIHKGLCKADKRWDAAIASAQLQSPRLPRGHIVGAVRFDGPIEDFTADADWVAGPVVNRIGEVLLLPEPVPHTGALNLGWKVNAEAVAAIQKQFNTEAKPPSPAIIRAAQLGLRLRQA